MPKVAKPLSTGNQYRSAPYPVATATVIAPAPAPTMLTQGAPSPTHSRADRQSSGAWDSENDEKLMRARQQGLNWQPIASQYFPGKTANACRKRHERLMEKRNSSGSWDADKIQSMAKAYQEVREQMWTILADRVGMKWQNVESMVCIFLSAWADMSQG